MLPLHGMLQLASISTFFLSLSPGVPPYLFISYIKIKCDPFKIKIWAFRPSLGSTFTFSFLTGSSWLSSYLIVFTFYPKGLYSGRTIVYHPAILLISSLGVWGLGIIKINANTTTLLFHRFFKDRRSFRLSSWSSCTSPQICLVFSQHMGSATNKIHFLQRTLERGTFFSFLTYFFSNKNFRGLVLLLREMSSGLRKAANGVQSREQGPRIPEGSVQPSQILWGRLHD